MSGPWWLAQGDPLLLALVLVAAVVAGLLIHHLVALCCRQASGEWLGVAAALVAAAPLLGLLGTVSGLIASFDALALNPDPRAAGAGIARALSTTQVGLLIAVPGLLALHLLLGWQRRGEDRAANAQEPRP